MTTKIIRKQLGSKGSQRFARPSLRAFLFAMTRHLLFAYLKLTHYKWNSKISRWLDWVDNK